MLINLLYESSVKINENISIKIPFVRDIYNYGEENYYKICQTLTSVPYDLMVQLDDIGIDYETIDEYILFLTMLENFSKNEDLSIVFNDLDFQKLRVAQNNERKELVMIDENENEIINKIAYYNITDVIRRIHNWKKTINKAGNKEAKKYLIERNRIKQKRANSKRRNSFLDNIIIQLVNTEEFKYSYEECLDVSIYQLNASFQQIQKKKNWEQIMYGVHAKTVDMKQINIEKLHWASAE